MIITSKIQTDLMHAGEVAVIEAVQDDKYSRNVELSLFAGGVPWEIPAGTAAVVRYMKPDGTGGSYDTLPDSTPACTISGSVITAALAPQVCTAPGLVRMAVCLMEGETEISTFAINLVVHRNPGINTESEDYTNMSMYVSSHGWMPNMFLATDENGDLITVEPPAGIDVTTEDVLNVLMEVTSINVVLENRAITFTTILSNGASSVSQVTLDHKGFPSNIVTDGTVCAVNWTGFEDAALLIWEGGSY